MRAAAFPGDAIQERCYIASCVIVMSTSVLREHFPSQLSIYLRGRIDFSGSSKDAIFDTGVAECLLYI